MPLIRIQLRINEASEVILIIVTEILYRARIFPVAGTHVSRAGESAIIARTLSQTVKPFRAIGLRTGPFPNDGPFVGAG